jgi:hypothetical protein
MPATPPSTAAPWLLLGPTLTRETQPFTQKRFLHPRPYGHRTTGLLLARVAQAAQEYCPNLANYVLAGGRNSQSSSFLLVEGRLLRQRQVDISAGPSSRHCPHCGTSKRVQRDAQSSDITQVWARGAHSMVGRPILRAIILNNKL